MTFLHLDEHGAWAEDRAPEKPAHNPEAAEKVRSLLSTLTPLQREVVQLRANGLKHREIGAILWPDLSEGRAQGRSESTWANARRKLRGEPTHSQLYHRRHYRPRQRKRVKPRRAMTVLERDPFLETVRMALASSGSTRET